MSWTNRSPLPANWPAIKAGVLRRDRQTCRIAGPECSVTATEVDHIVNRAEGGSNQPANLQAACSTCHSAKTKAEAARGRARAPKARRPAERHPGLT